MAQLSRPDRARRHEGARSLCGHGQADGGVVLPPVYVATDTIKPLKGFKHTLEHGEETIKTLCRQFLEQLADEGFKVLIVMTGHYGVCIRPLWSIPPTHLRPTHPDLKVWAFPDKEPMEGHFNGDHAAIGETSFQLLFDAGLVDLSLVPQDRAPTLDDDGVWGDDPKDASAERGRRMLKAFLDHTSARIQNPPLK